MLVRFEHHLELESSPDKHRVVDVSFEADFVTADPGPEAAPQLDDRRGRLGLIGAARQRREAIDDQSRTTDTANACRSPMTFAGHRLLL
jgi:hypothetical protein